MPAFGSSSRARLETAHPDLQQLFNEVIKFYDCTVVEGHRPKSAQDKYFSQGASKVQWPDSKHNQTPSLAVDVAPYEKGGIDWTDRQCTQFGGFVMGVAAQMGITIRWGGDWDRDNNVDDQTFNDLVHFELVEL